MSARLESEVQHYTSEQVEQHAEEALAILERLDPPEDLRTACFAGCLNLLAAKQLFYEQVTLNSGHLLGHPRPN